MASAKICFHPLALQPQIDGGSAIVLHVGQVAGLDPGVVRVEGEVDGDSGVDPGPRPVGLALDGGVRAHQLYDLITDAGDAWWGGRLEARRDAERRLVPALVLHTPTDPTMHTAVDAMLTKARTSSTHNLSVEGQFLLTAATAAASGAYLDGLLGKAGYRVLHAPRD
ncbi:hypothetical protein [Embleya sp. NPDC005575]|uniref:hypothetical protein n=1 Tax=Embleya sp. NPDC005575 TaxID=3156892 RepID=UPI0033AB9D7F